jgi:hypothetical protein
MVVVNLEERKRKKFLEKLIVLNIEGKRNFQKNSINKNILGEIKNILKRIHVLKERKHAHVGCVMKKDIMQMNVLKRKILKKKP